MGTTAHADGRPRIHIWPSRDGRKFAASIGVHGQRTTDLPSAGLALDAALGRLGGTMAAVVIIEPAP